MRVVSPDKTSLSETRVARCGMSLRDLDVQWMCQRASAGSRRNRPRYPNRIWDTIGRSERIRTSDPRLPKTVLYQAELHSGNSVAILSAGALQPWSQVRRALVIAMVWGQGKRLDTAICKCDDFPPIARAVLGPKKEAAVMSVRGESTPPVKYAPVWKTKSGIDKFED